MTTRSPATTGTPSVTGWPLMERAIVASVLGLPGYAAIGIALGFTGLGVFIDLERISGLGTVFKICYFIGCVLSVGWVKRRALFGPMVQPPLLLAVAVPSVVLASGNTGRGGGAARLLSIATPLLNGFPTMAVTTVFVLVIGILRYRMQRPDASDRAADLAPRGDHLARTPAAVEPPTGGASIGASHPHVAQTSASRGHTSQAPPAAATAARARSEADHARSEPRQARSDEQARPEAQQPPRPPGRHPDVKRPKGRPPADPDADAATSVLPAATDDPRRS